MPPITTRWSSASPSRWTCRRAGRASRAPAPYRPMTRRSGPQRRDQPLDVGLVVPGTRTRPARWPVGLHVQRRLEVLPALTWMSCAASRAASPSATSPSSVKLTRPERVRAPRSCRVAARQLGQALAGQPGQRLHACRDRFEPRASASATATPAAQGAAPLVARPFPVAARRRRPPAQGADCTSTQGGSSRSTKSWRTYSAVPRGPRRCLRPALFSTSQPSACVHRQAFHGLPASMK